MSIFTLHVENDIWRESFYFSPVGKRTFLWVREKRFGGGTRKTRAQRELKKGYKGELASLQNCGSRFLPNCLFSGPTVAGRIEQVKGHPLPHPSSLGSGRSEWRWIKILHVWQRILGQKWPGWVGAWGVLLFESNPRQLLESSRDFGDRTTLPLGVLTSKRYMLMEAKDGGLRQKCQEVMAGLPPEAAASSFCSWITFSEMIWLRLLRITESGNSRSAVFSRRMHGWLASAVVWTCPVIGCREVTALVGLMTRSPQMVGRKWKYTSDPATTPQPPTCTPPGRH